MNETNFDKIRFEDLSKNNPVWVTLCTTLVNGHYMKSKVFTIGFRIEGLGFRV